MRIEKTTDNSCPQCGKETLDIYYIGPRPAKVGARCRNCKFVGFYVGDFLMPIMGPPVLARFSDGSHL